MWDFRRKCRVLGAGAAVWGFRCSCVPFKMQVQLCGVLGADAAVWGFRCRCRVLGA